LDVDCILNCQVKQFRKEDLDLTAMEIFRNPGTNDPWPEDRNPLPQVTAHALRALNRVWARIEKSWEVVVQECDKTCECAIDPKDPTRWKERKQSLRVLFTELQTQYRATATYTAKARTIDGECLPVEKEYDEEERPEEDESPGGGGGSSD